MALNGQRILSTAYSISRRFLSTSQASYGAHVHLPGAVGKTISAANSKKMKEGKKAEKSEMETVETSDIAETDAAVLTYVPEEHVVTRKVRVFRPAKNAMQSGLHNVRNWKIEFDSRERWENQTMGWSSSADPLSNVSMAMSFKSKEDAVEFVERQGWSCYVDEVPPKAMQPKSYAKNFSWNKRARRAMK